MTKFHVEQPQRINVTTTKLSSEFDPITPLENTIFETVISSNLDDISRKKRYKARERKLKKQERRLNRKKNKEEALRLKNIAKISTLPKNMEIDSADHHQSNEENLVNDLKSIISKRARESGPHVNLGLIEEDGTLVLCDDEIEQDVSFPEDDSIINAEEKIQNEKISSHTEHVKQTRKRRRHRKHTRTDPTQSQLASLQKKVDSHAEKLMHMTASDIAKSSISAGTVEPEYSSFQQEKAKTLQISAFDDSNILLGWGSWTGAGIDMKKQKADILKKMVRKQTDHSMRELERIQSRPDAKLDHVILSTKQPKTQQEFTVSHVPTEFETAQSYLRYLSKPSGREWISDKAHKNITKPKVVTKPGQIIRPAKLPKKAKNESGFGKPLKSKGKRK